MTRKEIRLFLNKVIPGIYFEFKIGSNNRCMDAPAIVDISSTIWINKKQFKDYNRTEQKVILMHEIGHILMGFGNDVSDSEYNAHIMALCLAEANKWKRLHNSIEKEILRWSKEYKWNDAKGKFRRYIIASKKYLRNMNYIKN